MKFGGTSVGTPAAIRKTAEVVAAARDRKPVVVVSALSGVTNQLLAAAQDARARTAPARELVRPLRDRHRRVLGELGLPRRLVDPDLAWLEEALHGIYLLRELTPRSLDYVASFGEVMSSKVVAAHLSKRKVPAKAWNAWDAGVVTDDGYTEAAVLPETYPAIKKALAPVLGEEVPVVTGFLGRTRTGERTTLGRGGSDYTAAIFGRALGAEEIQIWTDVSGIMSCDPRIVRNAYTLRHVTFAEAAELAYFGAKVLHPKTVEPAVEVGIPVRILNTFSPQDEGTLVLREVPDAGTRAAVQGLAVKRGNMLVNLTSTRMLDAEGYLSQVFEVLARHGVSVDCLATSEVSVSMTVDARYAEALKGATRELRRIARTTVSRGRAVICVVGEGISTVPGVAGRIFGVMGNEGINIELISQGASELNVTFVVRDAEADRALHALHATFMGQASA
ncbi:MAG: aspartate kinase [Chromatiales bacterium]|nr:aspartate kinase [Chromatiales bacterium]